MLRVKSQGIKVITIYLEGGMNVWTRFHAILSTRRWDISMQKSWGLWHDQENEKLIYFQLKIFRSNRA